MVRPLSSRHITRLVALGAVSPHDRAVGTGGGGPIDAPAVVVDPVLAKLLEIRPATSGTRATEADLEQPRPFDAKLGLASGAEVGVNAQFAGHAPCRLAGRQPKWALDTHDQFGRSETAPPGRSQRWRSP